MDLKLTGSQINLATREKPVTLQQPLKTITKRQRPSSRGSLVTPLCPTFKGRPASADVGQVSRKSAYQASDYSVKSSSRKISSSSSNILKLLLSEPINRSGDSGASSRQSMDDGDSDEIPEECPETTTEPEEENPAVVAPIAAKKITPQFNVKPQPPRINNRLQKSSQENRDKSTEKPDLPGRVSFSSNDVFEIDYSDFSDESSNPIESKDNIQTTTKKVVQFKEDITRQAPKMDSSTKIIEDYKKEIESLNRLHEEEMSKLTTEQSVLFFNNSNLVLPDNVDTSKDVVDSYLETIKESNSLEIFEQLESELMDNEEDLGDTKVEAECSPKLTILGTTVVSTWDNSQRTDHQITSSSSEDGNQDKEVVEIPPNNEMEKEDKVRLKLNVKSAVPTKKPSLPASRNLIRKPKTPQSTRFNPIKAQHPPLQTNPPEQKLRKSKSASNLKEENSLFDFQMDKVDSWMSMQKAHETDNMRALMLMKRPQSSHVQYNKEWRDTPSSKTDDEGNFSLEEANDCYSNESTTYEEMVSIIKEIEADKKKGNQRKSSKVDMEFQLRAEASDGEVQDPPPNDPVKKILTFLDDVESNCDRAIQRAHTLDSDRDDFQFAVEPDVMGTVPKMEDLLLLPNRHLARRVIAMYLRTNELSNAVQLAKENMKSVREERTKSVRTEKLNAQRALADQKRHFENIVSRHQVFVEQLLKDKGSLCEKVTSLTRRVESQNVAWEHKLESEVNRVRESCQASEKIRRERWIKENTKKIKELTVKGMELEINRMTEQHKQELTDARRQFQEELHAKLDEARHKYESMEKGIRESCAEDREAVIEKERSAIRERYERQLITEQHSFEEQKVRMSLEWNSERERILSEIKAKERDFETRKEALVAERNNMLDQLRMEHKEKIKQLNEKHRSEVNAMRDQFEKDFTIWKSEFESAQKLREIERENQIRTECRKERDAQIDNIVAKVDSEAQRHQQEYDLKLRRIKDKFEIDLKELEVAEGRAREKYLETRHRLAECEGSMQNMQTTVKQLEIELSHSKKLCNEFINEKDSNNEKARAEIRSEMEAKRKEHEDEIQKIYSRVQKAIQKKDATLEVLQGDNNILKERCLKLEAIIRQQRKDYCTK